MTKREEEVTIARRSISDEKLITFLRAVKTEGNILAIKLINQHLDLGQTLDQILLDGEEYGYTLSVEEEKENCYQIEFGCQAGPLAGDGGNWRVCFDDIGQIDTIEPIGFWMS